MKIKADWLTWLHAYKKREIQKTFSACPEYCFERGLELGAGDGFQSVLLSKHIGRLVSIEINKLLLSKESDASVEYRICSAGEAVQKSREHFFDIVYSSNLLEHVAEPIVLLSGIHRILKNDGITIHITPTPFWKLCQALLYVPANGIALIERLVRVRGIGNRLREIRFLLRELMTGLTTGANTMTDRADGEAIATGNNREFAPARSSGGSQTRHFLRRLLLPLPHGISETNRAEFTAFSKRRWIKAFNEAGFDLILIRKGPAASGYGLGWLWADWIVEKAGLASELIYIAQKKGCTSRFVRYFS